MKKALIQPNTIDPDTGKSYNRVCQIVEQGEEFEVAKPLYWVDCANTVEADKHEYKDKKFSIKTGEGLE